MITLKQLKCGESKTLEFKAKLPEKSEHYVKTIIAFANMQGGTLVIGVSDKNRKIVSVDPECAFKMMNSMANAVSDLCEPQVVPDIELQTLEDKTLIVVSVKPGPARPYFLASRGKEQGTYIRVGATTRPALEDKIRDLEMEGQRISWDELVCVGYEASPESIDILCRDIMDFRAAANLPQRRVTGSQLESWKLLKKDGRRYLATNAFVLLASDYFSCSKTQCAVFKGKDRTVFLDKREYTGPLYKQIESAIAFVLRNIRLGARIEGILRKESYELPFDAIREMIINAHCHRNFRDESCVQVAIYDDRLEVTSPGGLYGGLTFEEALQGRSRLRNRAVANVFNQMGLIEAWGTGLKRIQNAAKAYSLADPEFIEMPETFRVNLYRAALPIEDRQNNGDTTAKFGESSVKFGDLAISETQQSILRMIDTNSRISASVIAKSLSLSVRTIEKNIKTLRDAGLLKRHGRPRGGYWEIAEV